MADKSSYQRRVDNYAAKHGMTTEQARHAIYEQRRASVRTKAMQAGLSPEETRARERGHGTTPEHGRILAHATGQDYDQVATQSAQQALKIVRDAAKRGQRIEIAITDRNHGRDNLLTTWGNTRRGHNVAGTSAQAVLDAMKADNQTNFKKFLERTKFNARAYDSDGQYVYPAGVVDMEFTIYHAAGEETIVTNLPEDEEATIAARM